MFPWSLLEHFWVTFEGGVPRGITCWVTLQRGVSGGKTFGPLCIGGGTRGTTFGPLCIGRVPWVGTFGESLREMDLLWEPFECPLLQCLPEMSGHPFWFLGWLELDWQLFWAVHKSRWQFSWLPGILKSSLKGAKMPPIHILQSSLGTLLNLPATWNFQWYFFQAAGNSNRLASMRCRALATAASSCMWTCCQIWAGWTVGFFGWWTAGSASGPVGKPWSENQ